MIVFIVLSILGLATVVGGIMHALTWRNDEFDGQFEDNNQPR